MNKKKINYLIGFLIIVGVLVYVGTTTFKSSLQYYVSVSELKANWDAQKDRTLKVAGVARGVVQNQGEYRFEVVENEVALPVVYKGFAPDTFKEGSQVVVTGKLGSDGVFVATEILAKCASKYEAKVK